MSIQRSKPRITLLALCLTLSIGMAQAEQIKPVRTVSNVDMVTAGVNGINNGTGTISVTGISGPVKKAFLYWHGFNNAGPYSKSTISFNSSSVTGSPLGISGTNCWGAGQSQAFEADVTSIVTADGNYSLAGLAGTGDSVNGASLVVLFNDSDNTNNLGVVFYTGNDSTHGGEEFGDAGGWQATLPGINYSATGTITATLHVADGQAAGDGPVTFSTADGTVTIEDTPLLFDGVSVPSGAAKRGGNGLYDIHTFNIKPAFGATSGTKTLTMNAPPGNDCLALVAMTLNFNPPAQAPVVGGPVFTSCAAEGFSGPKLTLCKQVCELPQSPSRLSALIKMYIAAFKEDPPCGR